MYQLSNAGLSALPQSLPLPRFGATAAAETLTTGMFHFFPLFPMEIRLQIWRMALLEPAVWFATYPEFPPMNMEGDHEIVTHDRGKMTLTPVGPVPYVVGFACRESRREMEVVMPKPLRTRADGRVFWICWDTTVLHLGQYGNAWRFSHVLDLDEEASLRHVAVEHVWGGVDSLHMVSGALAYGSHGLRTLVVHIRAIDVADDRLDLLNCPVTRLLSCEVEPQLTPSATTAALYTARFILDSTRPEISEVRLIQQPDRQMWWNRTRRSHAKYPFIEEEWDESEIPKVHLLHLDPAQF